MFSNAYSFEGQDLSRWDTSSVTNMYEVFHGAVNFVDTINTWNVSSVETFVKMFHGASNFNGNLSKWDTSNVVYMSEMFSYAYKFEGNGLSNWNTANVKSMHSQFFSASVFNGDISNWDTRKVEDMSEMVREVLRRCFSRMLQSTHVFYSYAKCNFLMFSFRVLMLSILIFPIGMFRAWYKCMKCSLMLKISIKVCVHGTQR